MDISEGDPPKTYQRFLPFDRLRYLMIILVVLQHSANSYGKLVPWWYVWDPNPSLNPFFDWFRQFPDIIIMPVLFFLAGFFALPSLRKQGLRHFLKIKCAKLLVPWLVCVTLIVPLIHYIYHVSRADTLAKKGFNYYWFLFLSDIKQFPVGFIDSMDQFNQNFTWFISLLFIFFLVFALSHSIKNKLASKNGDLYKHLPPESKSQTTLAERNRGHSSYKTRDRFSWLIIIGVGIICSLSYFVINSYMPFERWAIIFNIIQFQSPRLIIYISYFCLGVYAYTQQWFLKNNPPGKLMLWGSISVVLLCIYMSLQPEANRPSITLFFSFIRYFLCLSILFSMTILASRYLAKPSKTHEFLARNSFYVYLVHMLLVVLAQLFFKQFTSLNTLIKFCGVAIISVTGSYLLSCFLLKPFPRISLFVILMSLLVFGIVTG